MIINANMIYSMCYSNLTQINYGSMQNCIINVIYVTQLDDFGSQEFISLSIYNGATNCNHVTLSPDLASLFVIRPL